jgi:hypothetical protein
VNIETRGIVADKTSPRAAGFVVAFYSLIALSLFNAAPSRAAQECCFTMPPAAQGTCSFDMLKPLVGCPDVCYSERLHWLPLASINCESLPFAISFSVGTGRCSQPEGIV